MPETLSSNVPSEYATCIHQKCRVASTCLRQIAYAELVKERKHFRIVNPEQACKNSKCVFYRSNKPVRYARGFKGFQKRMFPEQYDRFMTSLCLHFGRNAYYKRRRGDFAMPPEEQEVVLSALRKVGVKEKLDFDSYEEAVFWGV